jgi:DNA-binding response OmpR family regulator
MSVSLEDKPAQPLPTGLASHQGHGVDENVERSGRASEDGGPIDDVEAAGAAGPARFFSSLAQDSPDRIADGGDASSPADAGGDLRATILVVDDEPAVRRVLVMRLQLAGYRVICAEDGEEALSLFHREQPDLVVLDVMLPKLDGFAVCRRLRAESCVPIIFLSALDAISERVAGLDLGADDYLPKPFSPKELEARIATILRRVGRGSAAAEPRELSSGSGVLRVGDLVVDTNRRQVTRDGQRIALTYTEFSLLELLFREPGRVVPRAEILEQLWGYPPRRAADLRVVDVYVARLRGKLEPDPRNPELILTVRGTGYASQRMADATMAAAG